jgi:hypothetical protein
MMICQSLRVRPRKTGRKGTLAEFFAASPLRGSDLEIERAQGEVREVDL